MNKPAKYAVALVAAVVAVGAVAVVAVPIVARSITLQSSAASQQVVPTVVAEPEQQGSTASTSSSTWRLGPGSSVGYRMTTIDGLEVTGSTTEIDGVVSRTGDSITDAEFMLDLASLVGDDPTRSVLLRALVAATGGNSTASFVLTEPIDLTSATTTVHGEQVVAITGVLTVRGVSNQVHADAVVDFDDSHGAVTASIPIDLAAYGISLAGFSVVQVEDIAYVDIDLEAQPGR
ncbi:YceI family protein [Herbiconiux sp. P15]|uniref:YceI family protein n=1 Tax=Herbiconiux liukaitaii TaxID=3342799 RepID=UPI0035BA7ABF